VKRIKTDKNPENHIYDGFPDFFVLRKLPAMPGSSEKALAFHITEKLLLI